MNIEKPGIHKRNKIVEKAIDSIKPELKKTIKKSIEKNKKRKETIRSTQGFSEVLTADFDGNKITIEIILHRPDMNIKYSFNLEDLNTGLNSAVSSIEISKKSQEETKEKEKILQNQVNDFKEGLHRCILKIIAEIKDQQSF